MGMGFKSAIKAIDQQIEFYEYLKSKAFHAKRKRYIERGVKTPVLNAARNTVWSFVYEGYDENPSMPRTYRLYRSIKVAVGSESPSTAQVDIYSDPSISPAKLLAGYTYAAFFIEPVAFNTFLQPRGRKSPNTYRPFYGAWVRFMENFMPVWARDKTEAAILSSLPKTLRGKEGE